jgi:L-aspartate oxidase
MTGKVGVIRDDAALVSALQTIAGLKQSAASDPRLDNMLTTAKLITTAALMRKESRGLTTAATTPKPTRSLPIAAC